MYPSIFDKRNEDLVGLVFSGIQICQGLAMRMVKQGINNIN